MKNKFFVSVLFSVFIVFSSMAQTRDVSKLTRSEILSMSYDELADMPFEDVMQLTKILGVSLNELYEMLLNKDVTSASKKAESSFDSPLSTTVISYDQIIASGARNIQEALRLVPGMIVREKTNGNYDIHIRGNDNVPDNNLSVYSENSMTLVMINGRPVYNNINGGTFWESLPVDFADIDRIEIVRGASSALYGANAVSGVINIITKNPDSEQIQIFGQMQGGNLGSYMGSLSVGQKLGKFSYRVSGNYQKMDRTTDKLYVFNGGQSGWFDKDSITDDNGKYMMNATYPWITVFNKNEKINDWYKDPSTAVDRFGANAAFSFDLSNDIKFSLMGGYQGSYATSSSFGDPPVSATAREMDGAYVDFIANVKGLNLQANLLTGTQDIVRNNVGFKVDNFATNIMAEYDFNLGTLNLRPGVFFQMCKYDDTPYLTPNSEGKYNTGYLNGEASTKSFAGSLRADYKMLDDKLRLIGALRVEKFSVSDDIYLPFQLVASYKLNDKNLFRAVYSSANKGPFIVDSYSNFEWNREGNRPVPLKMNFSGDKKQKLAKMNMIELGYRVRPLANLSVDLEAFSTVTKDFGCLLPESMTAFVHVDSMVANVSLPQIGIVYQAKQPAPAPAIPNEVNLKYQNIDVESHQMGVTLNIEWVATEKLLFSIFGTFQNTEMKNHICYNNSTIITDMTTLATANASQGQGIVGQGVDNYFVVPFKSGVKQQLDAGGMQQIEAGVTQQILVQQLMGAGMSQEQAIIQSVQMMKSNSAEVQAVASQVHEMAEQAEIDAQGIPSAVAGMTFDADAFDATLSSLQANSMYQMLYGQGSSYDNRYSKATVKHKSTPSFYGGFSVNYAPIEKLNLFASGYFYSKQTFTNSNGTFEIDPKFTLNCKVSYKVWKDVAVFVNARNVFNSDKQEFAWMDKAKGCYLAGLDLKF